MKDAIRGYSATNLRFEEIPVPHITVVPGWDDAQVVVWEYPKALIAAHKPLEECYDLEEDDEAWLNVYRTRWKSVAVARRLEGHDFDLTATVMEKLIDILETRTGKRDEPDSVIELETVMPELRPVAPASVATHVYWYWYGKRLRLGKALHRLCRPDPSWDNPNPFLTFRPRLDTPLARRRKLRDDKGTYDFLQKFMRQLRGTKELTELVLLREEQKRTLLNVQIDSFNADLVYSALPQTERARVEAMLQQSPMSARGEVDLRGEVALFRRVFPDPDDYDYYHDDGVVVDDDDDDGDDGDDNVCHMGDEAWNASLKEELLGPDLAHLAHACCVRLPGVRPFLGVPRRSRLGTHRICFEPVKRSDLIQLQDRLKAAQSSYGVLGPGFGESSKKRTRLNAAFEAVRADIASLRAQTVPPFRWRDSSADETVEDGDDEKRTVLEEEEEEVSRHILPHVGWQEGRLCNLYPALDRVYEYSGSTSSSLVEKRRRVLRGNMIL